MSKFKDNFSSESFYPDSNYSDEIIRLGIDFNIGKMSCVCAVIRDNKLYIFDEIRAHDTAQLAKEIKTRFPHNRLYGYPDSSGGARSTNATKTDIQILEGYSISNQSGASNPSIKDSVNNVQRLLCNGKEEIRLFVHPRCKNVIESLELQSYSESGEPEKTGLDPNDKSDASWLDSLEDEDDGYEPVVPRTSGLVKDPGADPSYLKDFVLSAGVGLTNGIEETLDTIGDLTGETGIETLDYVLDPNNRLIPRWYKSKRKAI